MSLDDRVRQGLRTLEGPEVDPARELGRFRGSAYPRRARRHVLQGIAGGIAAVALAVGLTTAVTNAARKGTDFINPGPKGVPACAPGDTQGAIDSGMGGGVDAITFGVTNVSPKACWIDETVTLTISHNGNATGNAVLAEILPIQGNGASIHLVGVVPAASKPASELEVTWLWRNWCDKGTSFFFEFWEYKGTTRNPLSNGTDFAPSVPACTDRSKPSTISTQSPILTNFPPTRSLIQDPHIIAPTSGLTNLRAEYIDQIIVAPDGKTLTVSFQHGQICDLLARVDHKEDSRAITLTVYTGDPPAGACTQNDSGILNDAVKIVLDQPLGNRHVVDGFDPNHVIPMILEER
jgi:hypothetical protein